MSDTGHAQAQGAPQVTGGRVAGPVCSCCGESIGVYEPLIAVERGRARRTSRAAEPQIATSPGEYRHLECHVLRGRAAEQDAREHMRTHGPAHARESVLAG